MRVKIPTIPLSNKTNIPVIGLGTWKLKQTQTYRIVRDAIRMGYRHIDCSPYYRNEKEIGKAINDCLEDVHLVVKREELYITTKLWNTQHRPDCVELACKQSLRDLCVDYLDLFLMHWPMAYKEGSAFVPLDVTGRVLYSNVKYIDTWQAMEELVKKNLTKSIGLANFNKRQIEDVLKIATVKPVVNQVECHPFLNQADLKSFCNSKGMSIVCYSPLGSSDRPWAKESDTTVLDCDTLLLLSKEYKKSPAQIALRYQFQRQNIVIPKTERKQRLFENANIFDFTINAKDMDLINSVNKKKRYIALKGDQRHPYYPFNDAF